MPVETTPESYPVETTPESEEVGTLDNVNERAPAFEGSPPVACLPFKSTSENQREYPRYRTRASTRRVPPFVRAPYDYAAAMNWSAQISKMIRRNRARLASISNPSYNSYRRYGRHSYSTWSEVRQHHRLTEARRTHSMALRASTDIKRQRAATNAAWATSLAYVLNSL